MAQLLISAAELQHYASKLKTMEEEMNQNFQQIKAKMNEVESIWSSPASTRLMEEFSSLVPVFNNYVQTIENHVSYLSQTAQAYEENERMMEQNIHA